MRAFKSGARSREWNRPFRWVGEAAACLVLIVAANIPAQTAPVVREPSNTVALPLADLWNGKAGWARDVDGIGSAFGFHFPSIVQSNGELWAYYIHNYTTPDGKA